MTLSDQRKPFRIGHANLILESFVSIRLYYGERELRMRWPPQHDFPARLRGDGTWPVYGYNQRPTGGTGMQALAQLIRYVRDLPRFPMKTWEYWASNAIALTNEKTLFLLRTSDYEDPQKTCCVLCGTNEYKKGLDWWSLDGVTGPCCFGGLCRNAKNS